MVVTTPSMWSAGAEAAGDPALARCGAPLPGTAAVDGKVTPPRSKYPQDDPRDPRSLDQVWREFQEETEEKNLLPIGCDPCGNYICIVIKGKTAGQIRLFDHECGYATGKLAPDFLTFLRNLKPMPPGDWPAWATNTMDTD